MHQEPRDHENLRAASRTRPKVSVTHCMLRSRIGQKRVETVQVHFAQEDAGLRVRRNDHEQKVYGDSYMVDYG